MFHPKNFGNLASFDIELLGLHLSIFSVLSENYRFIFDPGKGCGDFVELYSQHQTLPGIDKLFSLCIPFP